MTLLMSQAAYATSRGVSKQAIGDLVKRGIITLVDGKVDAAYADHQRALSLNPAKSKSLQAASPASTTPGTGRGSSVTQMSDYQMERAARERLERMTAQLVYDEKVGALIDKASTLRALTEAARTLRDQTMGLPRRLAGDLAGMTSDEIERLLEREFRAVLEEFANGLMKRFGGNG